jgi:uncharacterized membrane protein YsdA (DUF1294 family)
MEAGTLPLAWVGLASLVALGLAGLDKGRARRGGGRIRERTLLLAALAGGSPGLALGMLLFRHKTRKARFVLALLGIGAAQLGALWWLFPR